MKRKSIIIWTLCAVAAITALIWPMLPLAESPDRLANMPLDGPDFQSHQVDLSNADREFLGGANAVQRLVRLRTGGNLVMTVVDGSGNRHAVHDPTYCLAGGGWQVREKHTVALHSGSAVWIAMHKDSESMEALWFFDDGSSQFTSPLSYLARTSLRRATLGHSGPEPLLVMLKALPGEPIDWNRVRQILIPALGFQ
ncbi:MAG: exosortase-associated EpsI family protein [Verrucomicrobiales bacterium]